MNDDAFSRCQRNYDNASPFDNEPNLEPSIPYDVQYLYCPYCEIEKPFGEFEEVGDGDWNIVTCPDCSKDIWVTD